MGESASTPAAFPFEALLHFLHGLKGVGVDQLLSVHELLVRLAELGVLPDDLTTLGAQIGPIVCKSAREQADFALRFQAFCRAQAGTRDETRADAAPHDAWSPSLRAVQKRRKRWLVWGGSAVALGTAAVGAYSLASLTPDTPVAKVAPTAQPVTASAMPELPVGTSAPLVLRDALLHREAVPPSLEQSHWAALFALAVALVALQFLRMVRRYLEASRVLTRDLTRVPTSFETLPLHATSECLQDAAVRPLATVLRRSEVLGSEDLDIAASVRATARAAGRVVPVMRARRRSPEYLALIERSSPHDLQCALTDDYLDKLHAQEVHLRRYYYQDQPRLLFPADVELAPCLLTDLQSATADHRLLVFSDGMTLLSSLTGAPHAATDDLRHWAERALITPAPKGLWGVREQQLTTAGLSVLTGDAVGLARSRASDLPLPESFDEGGAPSPPLPPGLLERGRKWLSDDAPEPDALRLLLADLRSYLGAAGFLWLAASALYPQVRLPLSAAVGDALAAGNPSSPYTRALLGRMARLPWLRASYLPDWLREALLKALTVDQLKQVRAALRAVLLTAALPGAQGLLLELARDDQGVLGALWSAVTRRMHKTTPPDDAVRDRVFRSYMRRGLGVRLPVALWRRWAGRARELEVMATVGPPAVWASMLSTALFTGGAMVAALILFSPTPVSLGWRWSWFLSPAVAGVHMLRWLRPTYSLHTVASRVWRDSAAAVLTSAAVGLCAVTWPTVLTLQTASSLVDVLGPVAVIVLEWVGLVIVVLFVRKRTPTWNTLPAFVDTWLPDRWLFTARPRRVLPEPPSRLATALTALLVGLCSGGLLIPVYLLILPFRYLRFTAPSGAPVLSEGDDKADHWWVRICQPPFARSLWEAALCWLPLWFTNPEVPPLAWIARGLRMVTTGAYSVLPSEVAERDFGYINVAGPFGFLAALFVVARVARRLHAESVADTLELERKYGFIKRWMPERWYTLQPLAVPVLLFALAALGLTVTAQYYQLNPVLVAGIESTLMKLPGWPEEPRLAPTRTQQTGLRPPLALSADGKLLVGSKPGEKPPRALGLDWRNWFADPRTEDSLLLDTAGATLIDALRTGTDVPVLAFGAEHTTVASGAPLGNAIFVWTPGVQLPRILSTGKLTRVLALSEQSGIVVSGAPGGPLYLQSFDMLAKQVQIAEEASAVAVAADGQIAWGDSTGAVHHERAAAGRLVSKAGESWTKQRDDGVITAIVFSPDAKLIASGSRDGVVAIWREATPGSYKVIFRPVGLEVLALAFSPDGQFLVAALRDGSARLLHIDGSERAVLRPSSPVSAVAFSKDGTQILTVSVDGSLTHWDALRAAVPEHGKTSADRLLPAAGDGGLLGVAHSGAALPRGEDVRKETPDASDGLGPRLAERVSTSLVSTPSGADVYREGKLIGTTPITLTFAPGEARTTVELRKASYRAQTVSVLANEPKRLVRLALVKQSAVKTSTSAAAPNGPAPIRVSPAPGQQQPLAPAEALSDEGASAE